MRRPLRRSVRYLALSFALAVAAAACTGGDDDDATPSPSPTPVFDADACQVVFLNRVTPGPNGLVEFWIVDVPVADWVVGTHLYAAPGGPIERPSGQWYENYDLDAETFSRHAVATSGSFVLTAVTQTSGLFIRLVDDEPQAVWTVGTAGLIAYQGTSGAGLFEGFLSDPYSANVTAGIGAVTVLIEGTSRELGQDLSYAVCYKNTALARPDRMHETLRRIR